VPADRFRVLTWNLWWRFGEDLPGRQEAIRKTLAEIDADVICLQEVYGAADGADQVDELADHLGRERARTPQRFHDGWSFGNAVLSRWPVLAAHHERLPDGSGRPGHRMALLAELDAPFGRLPVVSTHLAFRFDESALRRRQLEAVLAFAAGHRGDPDRDPPLILCGDLNATPDSDEIRMVTGRSPAPVPGLVLTDSWPQVRDDPGHTWSRDNPYLADATWPQRRLDYVLVSWPRPAPLGNPVAAHLVGTEPVAGVVPSDHYGVAVDLRI
jgi:endonuclease/exonuclease/phosphatase family metal-dependent hydrolase